MMLYDPASEESETLMQWGLTHYPVLHIQAFADSEETYSSDDMEDSDTSSSKDTNTYYSLLQGLGVVAATERDFNIIGRTQTATCFGWHKPESSLYCNNRNGDMMQHNFDTKTSTLFRRGSPHSNADNQGLIIMGDLLISWHPNGPFWVASTSIKIWRLIGQQKRCLLTLNVDDTISEMGATPATLVGYSKESAKFHVWGFAA